LPGILRWQRATEGLGRYIFQQQWDGINRSGLGKREHIGAGTVERHFWYSLSRQAANLEPAEYLRVLGIDEHFFSRKLCFATTFCDLARHKVNDVVLGRSEATLERYPASFNRPRAGDGQESAQQSGRSQLNPQLGRPVSDPPEAAAEEPNHSRRCACRYSAGDS
jgi:hypothetical protein